MNLLLYPDAILRQKALPVTVFGPDLEVFCADLAEVLRRWRGAAIAAPQVGRLERIIVIAGEVVNPVAKPPALVLVNPEIISVNDHTAVEFEGCLSFPDVRVNIARPTSCVVRAQRPENGEVFEVIATTAYLARALLHECDHLEGKLLVDRASPIKREMIKKKMKRLAGKVILPPLPPKDLDQAKIEQLREEYASKGHCRDCRHFTRPNPPPKIPQGWRFGTCGGGGVNPEGKPVGKYVDRDYGCHRWAACDAAEETA